MRRVEGRVALVTGGVRGLGLATAECLLMEGAKVMITDIDQQAGEQQAARLGKNAMFMCQDVTRKDQWETVLDALVARWGRIDVLVNNAGIASILDIEHIDQSGWMQTIDVNLNAVFLGTQAAIARMKHNGGGASIINIASIEGLIGEAGLPAYNASKGGVRLFSRSTAIHCARSGYGIRVNSLCPGFADTQMVSGALARLDPETADRFAEATLQRIPMGRFARPDEIAAAVLFLASSESSYITGSDLVVDGGMTA